MEFVLKHIQFLEKLPSNVIVFELSMRAPNTIEDYLSKFKDTNEEYIISIEYLFKNDESIIQIKKMEHHFLLDIQVVIFPTNKDIVEHTNDIVVYYRHRR